MQTSTRQDAQRKVIVSSPENSEAPLSAGRGWLTLNRLFFVRNHFDVPEMDLSDWELQVGGRVEQEFRLNWDTLNSLPQRMVFATMECAGNGRSFLLGQAKGVQWGPGAVGHAEWRGVPLQAVLERAGLKPDALEIVVEGADQGTEPGHPGPMHFARSLPLEKALSPDTILATMMNGEPLEPNHGCPVRLIVPGWYGVTSVKWVTHIDVISQRFHGYFQSVKYTIKNRDGRGTHTEMVGPVPPKSEIIQPHQDEEFGA